MDALTFCEVRCDQTPPLWSLSSVVTFITLPGPYLLRSGSHGDSTASPGSRLCAGARVWFTMSREQTSCLWDGTHPKMLTGWLNSITQSPSQPRVCMHRKTTWQQHCGVMPVAFMLPVHALWLCPGSRSHPTASGPELGIRERTQSTCPKNQSWEYYPDCTWASKPELQLKHGSFLLWCDCVTTHLYSVKKKKKSNLNGEENVSCLIETELEGQQQETMETEDINDSWCSTTLSGITWTHNHVCRLKDFSPVVL